MHPWLHSLKQCINVGHYNIIIYTTDIRSISLHVIIIIVPHDLLVPLDHQLWSIEQRHQRERSCKRALCMLEAATYKNEAMVIAHEIRVLTSLSSIIPGRLHAVSLPSILRHSASSFDRTSPMI
jgi:hypothetical protein